LIYSPTARPGVCNVTRVSHVLCAKLQRAKRTSAARTVIIVFGWIFSPAKDLNEALVS
jgi:hypothetical protein